MTHIDRIIQFLTDEGFRPTQPEEDIIQFKRDGGTYFVLLDRADPRFYRIVFPNFFPLRTQQDRVTALHTANLINTRCKVGKVYLTPDNACAISELFCDHIDHFLAVLPRSIRATRDTALAFLEQMAKPDEPATPAVPPSPGPQTNITGEQPT